MFPCLTGTTLAHGLVSYLVPSEWTDNIENDRNHHHDEMFLNFTFNDKKGGDSWEI